MMNQDLIIDGVVANYSGLRVANKPSGTEKAINAFIEKKIPNWGAQASKKAHEICSILGVIVNVEQSISKRQKDPVTTFIKKLNRHTGRACRNDVAFP